MADRAPEVLLDQPVRLLGERLAVVEGAGDARDEAVANAASARASREVGLPVGDPHLDRREREVRPDAPPELRVLEDRAGLVEVANEALELVPGAERVRDPAAREHAREDLRARRVQTGNDALDERRAGRKGQELREEARIASQTRIARSGSRTPTWTCRPKLLFRHTT